MASQEVRSPASGRDSEMFNIPGIRLRFRGVTMTCIAHLFESRWLACLLNLPRRFDAHFLSPSRLFLSLCFCCLALCFGLLFSCVPVRAQTAGEGEAGIGSAEQGLRLVIVPEKNAFILREQYKPVVDFLTRKIGRNIYLEVTPDYISAVQALVDERGGCRFSQQLFLSAGQTTGGGRASGPTCLARDQECQPFLYHRQEEQQHPRILGYGG